MERAIKMLQAWGDTVSLTRGQKREWVFLVMIRMDIMNCGPCSQIIRNKQYKHVLKMCDFIHLCL